MLNAAKFFDTLTDKEIRRRQELCEKQITVAYDAHNDKALAKLRIMESDLQASMFKRA